MRLVGAEVFAVNLLRKPSLKLKRCSLNKKNTLLSTTRQNNSVICHHLVKQYKEEYGCNGVQLSSLHSSTLKCNSKYAEPK